MLLKKKTNSTRDKLFDNAVRSKLHNYRYLYEKELFVNKLRNCLQKPKKLWKILSHKVYQVKLKAANIGKFPITDNKIYNFIADLWLKC